MFPLEQNLFFLSKSSISGFSCFKNIYIYTCKKTCIQSLCLLIARGNARFFLDLLPKCMIGQTVHSSKNQKTNTLTGGGNVTLCSMQGRTNIQTSYSSIMLDIAALLGSWSRQLQNEFSKGSRQLKKRVPSQGSHKKRFFLKGTVSLF